MNKEKLISKIDKKIEMRKDASPFSYIDGTKDGLRAALRHVEKLEEPTAKEPIVVPVFFDEWYQEIKEAYPADAPYQDETRYQSKAIVLINQIGWGHTFEGAYGKDLREHYDEIYYNKEKYTRAILDGYVVEQEKRYRLRLPYPIIVNEEMMYLNYEIDDHQYYLTDKSEFMGHKTIFTDSEIEEIEKTHDLSDFVREEVVDE